MLSVGEVGRVHIGRWGEGGAHLHWWFIARPAGLPQLASSMAEIWDEVLPPTPSEIWRGQRRARRGGDAGALRESTVARRSPAWDGRFVARCANPTKPEIAVVRIALALISLAVIVDAFLDPEPGTSAGDHLGERARPGRYRRGSRGRLSEAPPLVAGTAGSERRSARPDRGDRRVELLCGVAGAALLGCAVLAARRAWRPRSEDPSTMRRYARRGGLLLALLFAVVFVIAPAGVSILATHKARSPVRPADLGRPYRDVSFRTRDGLLLRGWYVPSRNGAAVIAFPGRSGPVGRARMLARRGYGVLLFDRRGEGQSQGDYNGFGWNGERDLERRSDSSPRSRTSTGPGSVASVCRSAANCCCRRLPTLGSCGPSSPREPGSARFAITWRSTAVGRSAGSHPC